MQIKTNKLKKKGYEAPHAEIIEIETQGILCASAEDGTRGGTTNMNVNNGYDW